MKLKSGSEAISLPLSDFSSIPDKDEANRSRRPKSDNVAAERTAAAIPYEIARGELRQRVMDAIASPSTKRNYGTALENLFTFAAGRPLTRGLLVEFRESMKTASPSTANVRLAAVRKLVIEGQHSGFLTVNETEDLKGVLKMRQKVTHLATRLSDEQVTQMLAVPDRSTLTGKRDYCVLALLLGCSLRRGDLADILVDHVQEQDGQCFLRIAATRGSTARIAPVAVWVKEAIDAWRTAAQVDAGRLLRVISPAGDVLEEGLSQQSAWEIVLGAAEQVGIEGFDAADPRWFRINRSSASRFHEVQRLLGPVSAPEAARWASSNGSIGLLGKLLDGAIHKLSRKYDELAAEEEKEFGKPGPSKRKA